VVDDSVVVRGLVTRWLQDQPDLEFVGSAADGAQAIRKLADIEADVCLLDIEMPVMGGLEALPHLLRLRPGLKVLIVSRLTQRGAEVALRALELGAADYLAKPEASRLGGADAFREELFAKARALGPSGGETVIEADFESPMTSPEPPAGLRPLPANLPRPDLLVIGASTGGPQALRLFLHELGPAWPTPIVIVQHMPAAFTSLLAAHLDKPAGLSVQMAVHGRVLSPGVAHVAPGDFHLRVREKAGVMIAALDQGPEENFCRPAVDVLFRSAAEAFGARVLGVVLTGMGKDGVNGAAAIARAGGAVMAQDKDSSVVWGMPGAVIKAGWASVECPIEGLARAAKAIMRGERP